MSKTVELNIPKTAAARDAARSFGAGAFSDEWLEQLCAHVDEGGLVGEIAAKALLSEVLRLRELR